MPKPPTPHTLMTGLVVGESPRWHAGRLWFANWGAQEIVAVDLRGHREVIAHSPTPVGYSIDWLPDGRLLVTGQELVRREADGSLVRHADLSGLSRYGWNEIVVDGRGNIYVNSVGFHFGQEEFRPGIIALVTPDGSVRQVADGVAFPNGMVVTPDNTTLIVAESFTGTLTAFDIAPTAACRAAASGPTSAVRAKAMASAWTRRAPSGAPSCTRAGPPAGASARAARCCNGSSSSAAATPACSGARTAGPCSCWWPSGGARSAWVSCSARAPARC
jgi:sugar lactone lactonase YvrE